MLNIDLKSLPIFNNKYQTAWFRVGKGLEQTFFQRTYPIGQEAHEKMLSITNH